MAESFDLPLGYVLHVFDLLPSTMDEAHRLAQEGAPEGTLIIASRQSKGRGRQKRPWNSYAGNLHLSLIMKPHCPLQEVTALGFILCIALGHALVNFAPNSESISYKWPNDVLIHDKKLGGILLELEPSLRSASGPPLWVVAGIGVNFVQFPQDTLFAATSLLEENIPISLSQFLSVFCVELENLLRLWRAQGFEPIRKLWMSRAWGVGREMTLDNGREKIQGTFEGIHSDGGLKLRTFSSEQRIFSTGEIVLLNKQSNFLSDLTVKNKNKKYESC